MGFLKNLLERVTGKDRGREIAPAREVQAPHGQGPVERVLPEGGPTAPKHPERLWAEGVRFELAKSEELSVSGTRATDVWRDDPMETLTLLCRRCASDIAAQDDLT